MVFKFHLKWPLNGYFIFKGPQMLHGLEQRAWQSQDGSPLEGRTWHKCHVAGRLAPLVQGQSSCTRVLRVHLAILFTL